MHFVVVAAKQLGVAAVVGFAVAVVVIDHLAASVAWVVASAAWVGVASVALLVVVAAAKVDY